MGGGAAPPGGGAGPGAGAGAGAGARRRAGALSVAPMMAVTDRHFRALVRVLSRRVVSYTEMVVDLAAVNNPGLLDFSPEWEGAVVAQLGGRDPAALGAAAAACEARGYAGVNLNIGCPSERVSGKCSFGAALMMEPAVVTECLSAMRAAVGPRFPVTAKIRIGVDDHDSYEHLAGFVAELQGCGVAHVVVHARKAILGLSTKANRSVPPLQYEFVYRLVRDFPDLEFTLNGGVQSLEEALGHLDQGVHGVMIGRAAYSQGIGPMLFARADSAVYGCTEDPVPDGDAARAVELYAAYCEQVLDTFLQKEGDDPRPSYMIDCIQRVLKPLGYLYPTKKACLRARAVFSDQLHEWKTEMAAGKPARDLAPDLGALIRHAHCEAEAVAARAGGGRGATAGAGEGESAGGAGAAPAGAATQGQGVAPPCFPCGALFRRRGGPAARVDPGLPQRKAPEE